MRRARITYEGAFHHAMNRGYEGRIIFHTDQDRQFFLNLLAILQAQEKIRILAFCIMKNHYHLVVQDTSDRLADFFKQLNGQYATYYRQQYGGRGYLFQDRYKSMLVQDDAYLMIVLAYVLNNPVRAGLQNDYLSYRWSSAGTYFINEPLPWLDSAYVESLFGSMKEMSGFITGLEDLLLLPVVPTPMGLIVGGDEFVSVALERSERRSDGFSLEHRRVDDLFHDPVDKVIREFEGIHQVKLDGLDPGSAEGKRLRNELLFLLKEKAGLRYRDISRFDIFADIGLSGLRMIFRRVRTRKKGG